MTFIVIALILGLCAVSYFVLAPMLRFPRHPAHKGIPYPELQTDLVAEDWLPPSFDWRGFV